MTQPKSTSSPSVSSVDSQTSQTSHTESYSSTSSSSSDSLEEKTRLSKLFNAVVPDSVKRAIHQSVDQLQDETLKETLAADILRKAFEKGSEVKDQTEGSVRRLMQSVPNDVMDRLFHKLDEYKEEGLGMVQGEMRRFLDQVDIQKEVTHLLSQFTIEVTTQIRFVPQSEGQGIKPKIKTKTRMSRTSSEEEDTL
jgi:hypothetical protein